MNMIGQRGRSVHELYPVSIARAMPTSLLLLSFSRIKYQSIKPAVGPFLTSSMSRDPILLTKHTLPIQLRLFRALQAIYISYVVWGIYQRF